MNNSSKLGCLVMIIPIVAFLYMMFAKLDISPIVGTTMWIVFILGGILDKLNNSLNIWKNPYQEEKTENNDQNTDKNETKKRYLTSKTKIDNKLKKEKTLKLEETPIRKEEIKITENKQPNKNIQILNVENKPKSKPQTIKENLQSAEIENEKIIIDNKFVDYISIQKERINAFPILKIPRNNCIIRTHRFGSTKRRGFKEESFQTSINKILSKKYSVHGNVRLNTGRFTRPFEPDIAIICNTKKNIRIDIEIDEPYAGITRQPTHCIGFDLNRDNYFKDRGWIVIRFSEYQIHTQEKKCLKFIAALIHSIDNDFIIPSELQEINNLENEPLWDVLQAQKWEKAKYREEYLNHTFLITNDEPETLKRDFNEQEIREEELVISTSFGELDEGNLIGFNQNNIHQRDGRISFYPNKHIYTIDNVPVPSVSTIVSKFFPEFDTKRQAEIKAQQLGLTPIEVENMWDEIGKTSRDKGTFLHEQIENFYLERDYIETEEFQQFRQFLNEHQNLEPYRSEWRIFDEDYNIAGTIDLLVKNNDGSFDIYDWKRSKKVINTSNGLPIISNQYQQGIGELKNIDDTSHNRYSLQQSLYRFILEEKYNITIRNMYLIVLYPSYESYYKLSVPYMEEEMKYILRTL